MMDFREELDRIRMENNRIAWLLSGYINVCPRAITAEMIAESGCMDAPGQELFYKMLMAQICGLDYGTSDEEKSFYMRYWDKAIHRLDPDPYRQDPYYSNIHIPCIRKGKWELAMEQYTPFEAFICRDITLTGNLEEIPHAGYFDIGFNFPAVRQNGREWMAVKPNEIETMRLPLDNISGNVATLGLGLGYFTYMASQKDSVERITVIERDRDAIGLFKEFILPQFPHKDKVRIVEADAFSYAMDKMPEMDFDYVFADLWHDAGDGLEMYLKLKRIENLVPQSCFLYWIEESLLSRLRWQMFDTSIASCHTKEEAMALLSDTALRAMAAIL